MLKKGIHIKGQTQVQAKLLRVEGLCGEEKGRDRVGKEMTEEEGEEEEDGEEKEVEEGDLECAHALVNAFEFLINLLTLKCKMFTLHGCQALHHNFRENLDAIKSVMDEIHQTVSSIAGKSSILMARMQERASEASFSCLLSMHSCSSTCGTISA